MLPWAKRIWKSAGATRELLFPLSSWSQERKMTCGSCSPYTRGETLLTRVGNGRQEICTNRSRQSNSNLSFRPRAFQPLFLRVSLCSACCVGNEALPRLWALHFSCGGLTAMEQLLYFSPANLSSVSLIPMPSSPLTHLVGPPTKCSQSSLSCGGHRGWGWTNSRTPITHQFMADGGDAKTVKI